MILYRLKMERDYEWSNDPEKVAAAKAANAARLEQARTIVDIPDADDRHIEAIVTAEQAMQLILMGFCGTNFNSVTEKISPLSVNCRDEHDGVAQALDQITRKFIEALERSSDLRMNERCGQEQPGSGLWAVAETLLLEDACTDALQDALAKGWRIIAVQPQPDQRRPDYILGRSLANSTAERAYRSA